MDCLKLVLSGSDLSNSLGPYRPQPARLLCHGIFQARYWSRLPFPPPGDLPDPGMEPVSPASPALQTDSLPLSHQGSLKLNLLEKFIFIDYFKSILTISYL